MTEKQEIARLRAERDALRDMLHEVEVSWRTERVLYPSTMDAIRGVLARTWNRERAHNDERSDDA